MTQDQYTLRLESADRKLDDQILGSGLSLAEAAKFIREYECANVRFVNRDYGSFRYFELDNCGPGGNHTVISATVPKTGSYDEDKHRAVEMIDVQTIQRHDEFWSGSVSTDTAFQKRVEEIKEKRAIAAIDREIVTKVVDQLIAAGYRIACERDVRDPKDVGVQIDALAKQGYTVEAQEERFLRAERSASLSSLAALKITLLTSDGRSLSDHRIDCFVMALDRSLKDGTARAAFLRLLFEEEVLCVTVCKDDEPHFIEFEFGETGWGVVCDYSEELSGVIDPILRPYLPSSFVATDAGPTAAVSSVNSHTG